MNRNTLALLLMLDAIRLELRAQRWQPVNTAQEEQWQAMSDDQARHALALIANDAPQAAPAEARPGAAD